MTKEIARVVLYVGRMSAAVLVVVAVGCAGTDFAARCESLCDRSGDGCPGDVFVPGCVEDCLERVQGISEECARCIIDNSKGPDELDSCDVEFAPVSDDDCVEFCAQ